MYARVVCVTFASEIPAPPLAENAPVVDRALKDVDMPRDATVVAVVRGEHVVMPRGDTIFEIGSTTKAFTSTAMAMLVDEKKMSFDDPVRKHLAYFHLSDPCADSLVTMRDIVSHRTGLSTRSGRPASGSTWPKRPRCRR